MDATLQMDTTLQNYKLLVEVFKGYLDTAVTVHTSYYAFTGALTAYYLAHRKEHPFIKHALCIPLFLGLALFYVCYTGLDQALALQGIVNEVMKDLPIEGAPPVDILRQSLVVLGLLDVIICLGLSLLVFRPHWIFGNGGKHWPPRRLRA